MIKFVSKNICRVLVLLSLVFYSHNKASAQPDTPVVDLELKKAQVTLQDPISFSQEDLGVRMQYPSSFSVAPNPSKDVVLFLKSRDGVYPTFNIVLQPGDAKIIDRTAPDIRDEVVDSYRALGLIDAYAEYAEKKILDKREIFFTKINYAIKSVPVSSAVYIFPTVHNYMVFTFIDRPESFASNLATFDAVMRTVHLRDPAPISKKPQEGKTLLYWGGGVLVILILGAVVMYFRKDFSF